MNIFEFRNQLIKDYGSYFSSFIKIQDNKIDQKVNESISSGILWPDPLIQLNPSFQPGELIDELVEQGILHAECSNVFKIKPKPHGESRPLRLHKHQSDAIKAAKSGGNYVLTTGTGSGKSLAYIVPIVDYVLRQGSGKGIKAIVIYPMNALANSQEGELTKFLCHGYPDGKSLVTFARYTGQESDEVRQKIIANPPDILLTNYVMMELILTRPYEKNLVKAAEGLKFLVLDELHTYRGRQGADVAFLVRRIRDRLSDENLQCVGTSATIAGVGSLDEQKVEVAAIASRIFGAEVKTENVIGETVQRTTPFKTLDEPDFLEALKKCVADGKEKAPKTYNDFINDPLSIWIESIFGVSKEQDSDRLVRVNPRSIHGRNGAANELRKITELPVDRCARATEERLLDGYKCEPDPKSGKRPFEFRLHQFISCGDAVYATIEPEEDRYITLQGQQYKPGDRTKVLIPLVFCRECGQEYYCIQKAQRSDSDGSTFTPRNLRDRGGDDYEAGFLYYNHEKPWPSKMEQIIEKIPDDWVEPRDGTLIIKNNYRKYVPKTIHIGTDGIEVEDAIEFQYIPAPFRFCLNCGVTYGGRQRDDFLKLSSLGTAGRSTATTILSLSTVRNLKGNSDLPVEAQKLLSFTDNRQDASLQAGHFNDFVGIGLLRAALYKAVNDAGESGIRHEELTQKVFDALDLPLKYYTQNPDARFQALEDMKRALRDALGYRLYHDLRRGWRVTSPNLEQCGLLEIRYPSLNEVCQAEDLWEKRHDALATANPQIRVKILSVLLDYMRRELAIHVDYLDNVFLERMCQQSNQHLIEPWAIDENEKLEYSAILYPRSRPPGGKGGDVYLSPRGGFGQFLRRQSTFEEYKNRISQDETTLIISQLLELLRTAGLVKMAREPKKEDDVSGYQISAASMRWFAGDGTKAFHDPIRVPHESEEGGSTNPFFIDFYKKTALSTKGFEAREHTAQVDYELRIKREDRFRQGELPILFCSPTMELGVDIAELNIVNMRNIPPTPANYAQRSGRAGRSGQPAFVFSYCATGSSHDQYFFKRPEIMASGAVTPLRLELANEDLVRAHIHAIWLTEAGIDLRSSLKDVLDLESEGLEIRQHIKDAIESDEARNKARVRASEILETVIDDLKESDWYSDEWLDEVLLQVSRNFNLACERWRGLYKAAHQQSKLQSEIILDASKSPEDKKQAKRLRREAEAQLELLVEAKNLVQSDFYSYRYFASEGFLPGYNFPRLPLSAYIPGYRIRRKDEFLSRPRFLAISEFGPRAIIYHEGAHYRINKVILPVGHDDLLTSRAKRCNKCGYIHPIPDGDGPDLCEQCSSPLPQAIKALFRLENVSTRRRANINSDEEERMRMGYDILTGIRFTEHRAGPTFRSAIVKSEGNDVAELKYGHATTLWRMNLGWTQRKEKNLYGFILDTERGYWDKNEQAGDDEDVDPMSQNKERVVPYVEDTRNCLIFESKLDLNVEEIASLQSALKNAIQVKYQLEDNELAVEPLPTEDNRKMILFYESAEGGAGALRRLIDNKEALSQVAKEALDICHFDPGNGKDLKRALYAQEDCEAACYDCLMSYSNQKDHALLDRKAIKDYLLELTNSEVEVSPVEKPRAEHLEQLMRQADSGLEKKWLRYLEENNYRLPSKAQALIRKCSTRPDFIYEDYQAAIYIDGPPHDYPERQQRDNEQQESMEDYGYTVIRFRYDKDWGTIINEYPHIFGSHK